MKRLLVAAATSIAFWATSAGAVDFIYTGRIDTTLIPVAGIYRIEAWGAWGGGAGGPGGSGAFVGGDIALPAHTMLNIVVGGYGLTPDSEGAAGGGGASWVFESGASLPLLVAGGGGGAPAFYPPFGERAGGSAQVSTDGQDGFGGGAGGSAGQGGQGADAPYYGGGGGGAGWFSAGGDGAPGPGPEIAEGGSGPPTFVGGGLVGFYSECVPSPDYCPIDWASGGFGGGGAGGFGGGGGGGGFSGGGGGGTGGGALYPGGGGGGGSFFAPGFTNDVSGLNDQFGNGFVRITTLRVLPVPEAPVWSLLIVGVGLLGWILRRRGSRVPI